MKILLEISDNKAELFLEFIKNISFIKRAEKVASGQVTNLAVLQSIERFLLLFA